MTRKEAGRCAATTDGEHRWVETTTKEVRGEEYICGACRAVAVEPYRDLGHSIKVR